MSLSSFFMFPQVQATFSCSASSSSSWQICGPVESPNTLNVQPNVIQDNAGGLKMVWSSLVSNNLVVLYATGSWDGTSWSWGPGSSLTTSPGKNQDPVLAQLLNTTTYMFWSYKAPGTPNFQLYYVNDRSGSFSKTYTKLPLATSTPLNDTLPSAAVGRDGTLWLVWTRDNSTVAGTTKVMRQLWYETLKNGVWSPEHSLTLSSDANWNYQPSVVVGKDGVVRVAFSRGGASVSDIYSITYNGSVWSSPQPITTQTTTQDSWPTMAQDRNGTYWVFYARNTGTNTTAAYAVFQSSSTSGLSAWTTGSQLTPTSCGTSGCTDSEYPTAVQSTADKNIWVFYATDPVVNFNIYALKTTTPVSPVHDVAITPIAQVPSPVFFVTNVSQLYPGGIHDPFGWVNGVYSPIDQSALVQVTVRVSNNGDFTETVTLRLSATNTTATVFGTSIFQLPSGISTTIIMNWNTTGFRPARYGISGNASIPFETLGNKPDGLVSTPNLVHLFPPGDIDWDGSVTITDATDVFFAFNSSCFTISTCSSKYMAVQWADFAGAGVINIVDATIVSSDFNMFT